MAAASPAAGRIASVELLRCIAGTLVLWFHVSYSSRIPWVRASGNFGWCGVQIFFVVSGFIIPFAMARSGYAWPRDMGRFMARRLLRLDPPYLVASAGAAAIAYAAWNTPGFAGPPPAITWANTLAHIGYLNGILGLPWYDAACWTLGVEFQVYLLMAVAFPLVVARRSGLFAVVAAAAMTASLGLYRIGLLAEAKHPAPLLATWLPYFVLGIAAFRRFSKLDSVLVFGTVAAAATAIAACMGPFKGVVAALVAAGTIMLPGLRLPKGLAAYAALTYSLYLVHVPIGAKAMRLIQRFGTGYANDACALFAGLALSFISAYLLYRFAERPAMALASRIPMTGAGAGTPATIADMASRPAATLRRIPDSVQPDRGSTG